MPQKLLVNYSVVFKNNTKHFEREKAYGCVVAI